jgi:polyisoprenoid-binding protein YceI
VNLPIPSGTYGIDTMHTQLGFAVTHLGISVIRGTFDRFSGWLAVGDSLADTSLTIEAEMASMNSGNELRDGHMHGPDFFDVASRPTTGSAPARRSAGARSG